MGAATNDPSQMMTPTKPPVSVAAESEYVREIPKFPLGYDSECFHTVEHGLGESIAFNTPVPLFLLYSSFFLMNVVRGKTWNGLVLLQLWAIILS